MHPERHQTMAQMFEPLLPVWENYHPFGPVKFIPPLSWLLPAWRWNMAGVFMQADPCRSRMPLKTPLAWGLLICLPETFSRTALQPGIPSFRSLFLLLAFPLGGTPDLWLNAFSPTSSPLLFYSFTCPSNSPACLGESVFRENLQQHNSRSESWIVFQRWRNTSK